jgi:hypothetical protein
MKASIVMVAILLCGSVPAWAQESAGIVLSPPSPARWDLSAEAGWLGSNKSEVAPDWNDWFDVAAGGVAVGYYWTPNLRSELRMAFTSEGRVLEEQQIVVPGQRFPMFRLVEHRYRTRTLAAGLSYQFLENRWFHPLAGGGLDIVSEREAGVGTTTALRPFVTTGFKWYGNDRVFVRSDLRVSFGNGAASHVSWTAGIGVDL